MDIPAMPSGFKNLSCFFLIPSCVQQLLCPVTTSHDLTALRLVYLISMRSQSTRCHTGRALRPPSALRHFLHKNYAYNFVMLYGSALLCTHIPYSHCIVCPIWWRSQSHPSILPPGTFDGSRCFCATVPVSFRHGRASFGRRRFYLLI